MAGHVILKTRVVNANFANVPNRGYDANLVTAHAFWAQNPGLGGATELWRPSARDAFFDAAPARYRFKKIPMQSAIAIWDSEEWTKLSAWARLSHGPIRNVCDPRFAEVAVLEHNETDRDVKLTVEHHAPEAVHKGDRAMRSAAAARDLGVRRDRASARRTTRPSLFVGDFNDEDRILGTQVAPGRAVRYGTTGTIDQVIGVNGVTAHWFFDEEEYFRLPGSDHHKDGIPYPCGVAVNATLRAVA